MSEILKRLGLRDGACGDDSWAHNGGWYDKTGTKIGWGDIGKADLPKIQAGLKDDEVFFVVGEHDSYWNLPKSLNPTAPGLDFVIEKVRFFVTTKGVYRVQDGYSKNRGCVPMVERDQIRKVAGLV